jgi:hypothetical protein
MVHRYVQDNSHGLAIQVNQVKGFIFMFGFRSNGCFCDWRPCLNKDHGCGFASSISHSTLDSVRPLVYDDSVHIQGTSVVLQVLWDSANPVDREGINILGRPYGVEL